MSPNPPCPPYFALGLLGRQRFEIAKEFRGLEFALLCPNSYADWERTFLSEVWYPARVQPVRTKTQAADLIHRSAINWRASLKEDMTDSSWESKTATILLAQMEPHCGSVFLYARP